MKQILAITLAAFASLSAYSQAGYLGKKFSVGYNYEFTPWVSLTTRVNEYEYLSKNSSYPSFNEKFMVYIKGHNFNLGYTANRRLELFFNYGFRSMNYYAQSFSYEVSNDDPDYSDYQYTFIPDDFELRGKETSWDFGFRKYFEGYVAPVGVYQQFTFGQSTGRFDKAENTIKGTSLDYSDNKTDIKIKVADGLKVSSVRASYGLGIKRPLSNLIYFCFESNFHLPLTKLDHIKRSVWESEYQKEISLSNYDEALLNLNFASYRMFDVKFGLGIML